MASDYEPLRQTLHETAPKLSALKTDIENWIPERETVIEDLRSIAEEVDQIQHKSDVVTTVGSTTSLAGFGLFLVSGGVTFAAGLLVAGAVAAIIANMWNSLIGGALVQRAKQMMERDANGQNEIREKISEIETQVESLETVYSPEEMDKVRGVVYTSAHAKAKGLDLGIYSRKVHDNLVGLVPQISPGLAILDNAGLVGKIISQSWMVLVMPFVAFDLLSCLQRLINDKRPKCSEEIRKTVVKLEETKDHMVQMHRIIETGA